MSRMPSAQSAQDSVVHENQWITEKQAAKMMGLSVAWFQRGRWIGSPIPYTKFGRAVRYKLSDIRDFMERNKVGSTSEKVGVR